MSPVALNSVLDSILNVRIAAGIGISAILLGRFLHGFFSEERHIWLVALVYGVILAMMHLMPQEIPSLAGQALGTAGAAVMCLVLTHARMPMRTTYLLLTFLALRAIAYAIGRAVHMLCLHHWFTHVDAPDEARVIGYAACAFIYVATTTGLLWSGSSLISRVLTPYTELAGRECLLLIAPSAVALVADIVMGNLSQFVSNYVALGLQIEWNSCALEGTIFLSILATTALFVRARQARDAKAQQKLLDSQLADLHSYIDSMEDLYARMRSFRHDMANHLQTLEMLEAGGDRKAASAYARSGMDALLEALPAPCSGNPVADVILSRLQQEAEAQGIRFQQDFHWPPNSHLDAFDMGVVLHNAGSNALQAARGCADPFVCVRSILHHGTFIIEVHNRCLTCPSFDPLTGLPVRSPGQGQGIGLMNIRSIAEKYAGLVNVTCEDEVFVLTVLVPPVHNRKRSSHTGGA